MEKLVEYAKEVAKEVEVKKVDLVELKEVIDDNFKALEVMVKVLNDLGKTNSKEEADRIAEERFEDALDNLQSAYDRLGNMVKDASIEEQGYSPMDELNVVVKMMFINEKMEEIANILDKIIEA
jgi:hypothetical protein